MDGCEIKRCRAGADLIYLGHGVCDRHWEELMADDAPPDALRKALGIEVTPDAAMEEAMDDGKGKGTKSDAPAKAEAKGKKMKAAKESKGAKEITLKKVKEPREEQCVFAFRLTPAQRDALHAAAGGGRASAFVLNASLAAASGDVEAFKQVVASRATAK